MGVWTREDFDGIVSMAKKTAIESLVQGGAILQVAHVLGNINPETGKRERFGAVIGFACVAPETKDDIEHMLRNACTSLDAEGIVQVMEVWFRDTSPNTLKQHFPEVAPLDADAASKWVADNYERVRSAIEPSEAVVVLGEYHQHSEQHFLHFTRDGEDKPVFSDWQISESRSVGRFANLLPGARGD